ncbi:MAG: NAD(P)-dependent oxidoreductase [Bacteroidota bacterium]|nr:NAD(P)-dependent oxidoreductase [Bacteroidota bacterium]
MKERKEKTSGMSRCILIGGSGFLGRHVLEELIREQAEVHVVEHREKIPESSDYKIIPGGISSLHTGFLDKLKPDVIFHCARPTNPSLRWAGRKMAAGIAAGLNKRLLKSLQRCKLHPKLVFASGSLMYGNHEYPREESDELNPISFARQYYKGELPLVNACRRKEYPIQVLRFPWLLGDGSWFKWFYLENIDKKQAIPAFGEGQNMMHFLDVKDAATLMVGYARKAPFPRIHNIFSEQLMKQEEFLDILAGKFHADIRDYREVFDGGIEKEALEAFTSNIILRTEYPDILDQFKFRSLDESLENIGQ